MTNFEPGIYEKEINMAAGGGGIGANIIYFRSCLLFSHWFCIFLNYHRIANLGDLDFLTLDSVSGNSLDLNLGISCSSVGVQGNENTRNVHFQYGSCELHDGKKTKVLLSYN